MVHLLFAVPKWLQAMLSSAPEYSVQRIQRILSGTQAEVCKDIRQVNVSLIQIINVNVAAQVMLNVGLAGQLLNVSVHISYSHFVIISR